MAGLEASSGRARQLAPRERAGPPVQADRTYGRPVVLLVLLLGLVLVPPAGAEEETPVALLGRAAGLEEEGRVRDAEALYERVADLAAERGNDDLEATALFGCIRCAILRYDVMALRDASVRLRDVQIRMGDARAVALTEADLGYAEAELGNCRQALRYLESALAYFEEIGHEEFAAHVKMRMGHTYFQSCDYALALEYLEEATRSHRSRDDGVSTAEALIHLGNVVMEFGDIERALRHYEEALALYSEAGAEEEAIALGDIGIALIDMERYEEALEYLTRAEKAFEEAGDLPHSRVSALHRARIYFKTGRYEEALAKLDDVPMDAEADPIGFAYGQLYRGDVLAKLGRTEEAREIYAALTETTERSLQCRVRGALAELQLQEGDAAGALEEAKH
ncbi:MAG: tetratricopeptide repeat protein, partial [Planctomycetota bacterium]